jgi:hypothetical protein
MRPAIAKEERDTSVRWWCCHFEGPAKTPVMDKLEQISSGEKETAPAAENDATSVGGGKVATAEARSADTRGGSGGAGTGNYCRHQGGGGGSKDQCR